jgi:predicted transcriptional regulator
MLSNGLEALQQNTRIIVMNFNERLKQYIEYKGIIKHRVAEVAGITPSAFFRFLNGTSTMKSSNIEKINEVWPEMVAYSFGIEPDIAMRAKQLNEVIKPEDEA